MPHSADFSFDRLKLFLFFLFYTILEKHQKTHISHVLILNQIFSPPQHNIPFVNAPSFVEKYASADKQRNTVYYSFLNIIIKKRLTKGS